MKKSIIFLFAFLAFSTNVSANYIGLEELPVNNEDTKKVINSAIETANFELIKEWGSTISKINEDGGFCGSNKEAFGTVLIDKNFVNAEPDSSMYIRFMSLNNNSIMPTSCGNLDILKLPIKLPFKEKSPEFFIMTKNNETNKIISYNTDYVNKRDIVANIIANVPDEQYHALISIAIFPQNDHKIRNIALDKVLNGIDNQETLDSDFYKELRKNFKKVSDNNPNWRFSYNDNLYMSIVNPKLLLLINLNKEVLENLNKYSRDFKYDESKYPAFTKGVIAKGGYTDEEIKKMNLKEMPAVVLNNFNNANQSLRMFHKVFNSYKKEYDLNFQNSDGNTLFMDIFDRRTRYDLARNVFAGAFVRFYLEQGANPLLENKDKKTAFSMFLDSYGKGSEGKSVKDAFMKKDYDFSYLNTNEG